MATNTEKIDDLSKTAHTLTERVNTLHQEVKGLSRDLSRIKDALSRGETRLAVLGEQARKVREDVDKVNGVDLKTDITLLKEQVKNLQEAADKRGNRAWSVVPNIVGAIVSAIVSAVVAYYMTSRL